MGGHSIDSEKFMDQVHQVCNFAKLIPGFLSLGYEDQVTLLKLSIFEVLLVRMSGLFKNQVCEKHHEAPGHNLMCFD